MIATDQSVYTNFDSYCKIVTEHSDILIGHLHVVDFSLEKPLAKKIPEMSL